MASRALLSGAIPPSFGGETSCHSRFSTRSGAPGHTSLVTSGSQGVKVSPNDPARYSSSAYVYQPRSRRKKATMKRLVWITVLMAFISGCAQMAPRYSPSVVNVQNLRDSGAGKCAIGTIRADPKVGDKVNAITLRTHPLVSPYNEKFTDYLENALRTDFTLAGLLDPNSTVLIEGLMLSNDIDVSGASEGTGEMAVRVIVTRAGQVRYDKVKTSKITFEISFLGALSIPRGVQAYPELVQKFLADLYADYEFIDALK